MTQKKIAVFVGSLRKASLNRKMANALAAHAPESLKFEFVEIGGLPFYNEDIEQDPPAEWTHFRESVMQFDGFLFVTPEYNRSVPAALKNALDVGSRPYGKSVWAGKPGAVVTVSPGAVGGFGSNHHLRQSLVCLNVFTMAQPEAYIGNASNHFDENGNFANDSIGNFASKFLDAFASWIEIHTAGRK